MRHHLRPPLRNVKWRGSVLLVLVGEILLIARLTVLQRRRDDFTEIDTAAMVQVFIVFAIGGLLLLNYSKKDCYNSLVAINALASLLLFIVLLI